MQINLHEKTVGPQWGSHRPYKADLALLLSSEILGSWGFWRSLWVASNSFEFIDKPEVVG